jgi:hypothetical protein
MTNDSHSKVSKKGYGLLAIGSSDGWELTIDESLDEDLKWEAELEGPNIYISYSFQDLKIVGVALEYLQSRILDGREVVHGRSRSRNGLTLGKFGASRISLMWDDEDFDRCFIIVGPSSNSSIRLSLIGGDIKKLIGAFQKVVGQLPADPGDS